LSSFSMRTTVKVMIGLYGLLSFLLGELNKPRRSVRDPLSIYVCLAK
jgi:hypothetical protein